MEAVLIETEPNEAQKVLANVRSCALDPFSRRRLLNQQLRDHAWSPLAPRINGWRYSGPLEGSLVTRSVCGAYLERPEECSFAIEGGGALGGFGGRFGGITKDYLRTTLHR